MALKTCLLPSSLRCTLPPIFLYLATISVPCRSWQRRSITVNARKPQSHGPALATETDRLIPPPTYPAVLPAQCPGCGALTQSGEPDRAGYYSVGRKAVKIYLAQREVRGRHGHLSEAATFDQVLKNADERTLQSLGVKDGSSARAPIESFVEAPTPVCNRCHDLTHHHTGVPIIHPTLASIQDIISESPHKYNHVYHILDAADFPLSLISRIQHYLSLTPQRSLNRRSKTSKYSHGRKAEMSFIITRSDLLAPRKEQVDGLMPYLIEALRDALGHANKDVRLGNVRCVSSKRGWWTKEVKEAIWERGGGGWMVGKVNVGKSNLFECIFPKGRSQEVNFQSIRRAVLPASGGSTSELNPTLTDQHGEKLLEEESWQTKNDTLLDDTLLPPAPPEEHFPVMPIVSSLPGTTASPIRLLFGSGKGELVDLPGLSRDSLDDYVLDEHKQDLVMRQRIRPEQLSVKPGQSLVVGGIIRITPTDPDQVLLTYPFVPLDCHVTSTEKAVHLQKQSQSSGVPTIAKPNIGDMVRSAGIFKLRWDVTKQRAGPLTRSSAVGLKVQTLPFVVYSADLLLEGCGWIELVVQVRKRQIESQISDAEGSYNFGSFPQVEVFSPNGKHVGIRRPMNAWLLGGPKPLAAADRTTRPRRSMKGVKKNMKRIARATAET